jgi:hypothetical protein
MCESGRRCNQKKPEKNLKRANGAIEQALAHAAGRAGDVRAFRARINKARCIEKAFATFVVDDSNERVCRLARKYGKDIIQRLFRIDRDIVDSYLSSARIYGEFAPYADHEYWGHEGHLALELDASGRFAFQVASAIFDVAITEELAGMFDVALLKSSHAAEASVPEDLSAAHDLRSPLSERFPPHLEILFVGWSRRRRGAMRVDFELRIAQTWLVTTVHTDAGGIPRDDSEDYVTESVCSPSVKIDRRGARSVVRLKNSVTHED